jgi:type IV fimbrial biogenesis protein FimT
MVAREHSSIETRERGFTIIELMTVLVIAAILLAIGFPTLADALTTQRLRASGTDLMSSLLLARSEAIKRNGDVQIAPKSGTDWTTGWVVTAVATGEQFDKKEALGSRVAVAGAPALVTYQGNGRLNVAGVTRVTISDTDARAKARCLVIDPSGLPTLGIGSNSGC